MNEESSVASSTHIWRWATVLVVVALLLALYFYVMPPPPANWDKVEVGMTMEELNKLVPGMRYAETTPIPRASSFSNTSAWPEAWAYWGDETRNWQMVVQLEAGSRRVFSVQMIYRYEPWAWLHGPLIAIHRSSG